MAPDRHESDESDSVDEHVYPTAMASSLAGLPVRATTASQPTDISSQPQKSEYLDLVSCDSSTYTAHPLCIAVGVVVVVVRRARVSFDLVCFPLPTYLYYSPKF